MSTDPSRGNILIFTDDDTWGERLSGWTSAVGEQPVLITGPEKTLFERGNDERVDLVVTELDGAAHSTRRLLERLLSGELFLDVPQLHLLSDTALLARIREMHPHAASIAISSPASERDFQARVILAAEVGRLRRKLQESSIRDVVTGAYNREFMLLRLSQEFARAKRHRSPLSLVFLDIDQLASVDQRHDPEVRDKIVRQSSQVLASQVRREDVCGRWGESSFLTILPGTPYRGAAVFANKVRGDTEALRVAAEGRQLQIKISAGISTFHPQQELESAAELLQAAEQALLEARKRGGNRVFIDEAAMRGEKRMILIADPDAELLDMAEDILSMDDYRVIRTDSTSAMLETLKYRTPDLLILDLQMADQGDIAGLIERIHAMVPDTTLPIIGLSDQPGTETQSLVRQRVDRYITKPFSVTVLRSVARELVEQHSVAR